jgi:hypothetical protein
VSDRRPQEWGVRGHAQCSPRLATRLAGLPFGHAARSVRSSSVVRATAEAPVVSERLEVGLDEVESALRELLRLYTIALQFAVDMPLLGRSRTAGLFVAPHSEAVERRFSRWGSRPFTRVYVETHVRKHLRAIRDCLRLERLARHEKAEKERIAALEEELEENLKPLFRWRRAVGLLARLPPLAAIALPILSAASLVPVVSVSPTFFVVIALIIALGFWILVVWPSIRLGFRVKRLIFTGGVDSEHPLWAHPGIAIWTGFAAQAFYNDEGESRPKPFPKINVYEAENSVYRALRRRKPTEVPLDLVFAPIPYVWFAFSAFFIWGFIDAAVYGELRESVTASSIRLFFGALVAAGLFLFPRQGLKNYRARPH